MFYGKTITRMIPDQGQRSLTSYQTIVDTPPETNLVIQHHSLVSLLIFVLILHFNLLKWFLQHKKRYL